MKKRTLKSIVLTVVMVMVLAVSACGSKGVKTVEDYYNNPEVKAAFEEQLSAAAGHGMSINLEAKGNDFIMSYQYDANLVLPDDAVDQLEAALESTASIFEAEAKVFDEAIGQKGACTVIVKYLDSDGNLLAEKSFKAQ